MANKPWMVSADTVREVLKWPEAIAALDAVYSAPIKPGMAPPRAVARGEGRMWFRSLSAILPTGTFMGSKLFGLSREGSVSYLVALFDQQNGELACLLDAGALTEYRTAATSAVAIKAMSKPGKLRVAVLGSGAEAHSHVRALAAIREIESLKAYSPTEQNRLKFADLFSGELGISCKAALNARDAVAGVDLVIAAARSRDETPIFQSDWISPDTLVVSVGSTLPEQREIDTKLIERSDVIVVDMIEEVLKETGDFIAAHKDGLAFEHKVVELNEMLQPNSKVARPTSGVRMFKSVGSAIQDVAMAELAFRAARERGLAEQAPVEFSLKGAKKKA